MAVMILSLMGCALNSVNNKQDDVETAVQTLIKKSGFDGKDIVLDYSRCVDTNGLSSAIHRDIMSRILAELSNHVKITSFSGQLKQSFDDEIKEKGWKKRGVNFPKNNKIVGILHLCIKVVNTF
ncbi:hypothetical protein GMMP13_30031 [Candidatus Magnetomoraceae bacterium gMMP-13]